MNVRLLLGTMMTFFGLSVLMWQSAARAADALYASAPPPGSAFVRFINGDGSASGLTTIRGQQVHSAALGEIGEYFATPEGDAELAIGTAKTAQKLESGKYYSATLSGGKLAVIVDPAFNNRLKAQIVVINLSGAKTVSLKTEDGKVGVVESVSSGAIGAREVNPVKVGFSVYAGDNKIQDLAPRPLERGAGYAVVVYKGQDGKPAVSYDKATAQ
jgi:alginate O-acetyltransferase complex protein AlgF